MPITKSGRYSMNPAYAEALDRAMEEERESSADKKREASDAADKKKAAVKRIEIEPAENGGFVSRTHRDQTESADREKHEGWAPPYDEPELRAHPDGAHLLGFLGHELAK